jgi:hypothetical protein
MALTDEPAVKLNLWLDPLPDIWKGSNTEFPLILPVLDRSTPFYLDVTTFHEASNRLGRDVQIRVTYEDFAKSRYEYNATVDYKAIAPWRIGAPASERMAGSLKAIESTFVEVPDLPVKI